MTHYKVSVKDIAEFCCRSGDYGYSETPSPTAKQGQDIHRFLQNHQKNSSPDYAAEVAVTHTIDRAHHLTPYQMTIRGRADGCWIEEQQLTIEEIKTTFYNDEELPDAIYRVHLAQAKIYGYLIALLQENDTHAVVTITVTYWHLGKGRSYQRTDAHTVDALRSFFADTSNTYLSWIDRIHTHRIQRNQYIEQLEFPFSTYREGQRTLAAASYKTAKEKSTTFIHAATGIGKSISTLFGTLKALPETTIEQIWYLTAKTSGKSAINQAIDLLHQKHEGLKVLQLYNRNSTCFCDTLTIVENTGINEQCQWESGYYDRRMDALNDLFQHTMIDLTTLQQVATKHQLCPYHLAHEIVPWVDIVVCDFNFVFSFNARNPSLIEKKGKEVALLIDETHNLVNRCRDLYEASLDQHDFSLLFSLLGSSDKNLSSAIKALQKEIKKLPAESYSFPKSLFKHIEELKLQLDEWSQQSNLLFSPQEIINFKATLNHWMRLAKYAENGLGAKEGMPFSLKKEGKRVSLVNNNPAPVSNDLTSSFNSHLFFSGSLLPINYFSSQLSTKEPDQCRTLAIESPFPKGRLKVLVGDLDMSYQKRGAVIPRALEYAATLYLQKPGLYLVCVSSYQYLDQVKQVLASNSWNIPTLFQERSATSSEQEQFHRSLTAMTSGLAIVIMGGSFAEGIEWATGVLKGIVIMGSGMPSPTETQKRLQLYFNHNNIKNNDKNEYPPTKGFEFAFLYPAINRIIQTVGRIQRSEQDAGIAIILDRRYRQKSFISLFPSHWEPQAINSPEQLAESCNQFWDALDSFIL